MGTHSQGVFRDCTLGKRRSVTGGRSAHFRMKDDSQNETVAPSESRIYQAFAGGS